MTTSPPHRDRPLGQTGGSEQRPARRLVTLTALKAGTVVSEHHTRGWVSVQTTAGHLRIKLPDRLVDLPVGRLLILEQNVPHDVEALEESAFLLAIALPDRATG